MRDENKITIPDGATDIEIREIAKKQAFNGTYLTKICRKCGAYWMNPDAHTDNALIVKECKDCVVINE